MYRELAIPPGAAPMEFVYAPRNRGATTRALVLCVFAPALFVLSSFAAVALLAWPPLVSALSGAIVTALGLVFAIRGTRTERTTRLRVDGHELEVWAPGQAKGPVRMPLVELRDVALDTKAIERVIDGPSAIPAMRFADARVAPPLDVARIVLSFADGTVVPLSAERLSHLETMDVFGKMRLFLRKNGWQPADERELDP